MLASLTSFEERPRGMTQDSIAEQIRAKLSALPGLNLVMSQPISDRVDEMVSGVRADVAVMLYGDDLDVLVGNAREPDREVARRAFKELRIHVWTALANSNT